MNFDTMNIKKYSNIWIFLDAYIHSYEYLLYLRQHVYFFTNLSQKKTLVKNSTPFCIYILILNYTISTAAPCILDLTFSLKKNSAPVLIRECPLLLKWFHMVLSLFVLLYIICSHILFFIFCSVSQIYHILKKKKWFIVSNSSYNC